MIELLGPTGSVTMSDVMVTAAAFLAGWTKYAQKHKDDQLKARDDTIAYLETELKKCRDSK